MQKTAKNSVQKAAKADANEIRNESKCQAARRRVTDFYVIRLVPWYIYSL